MGVLQSTLGFDGSVDVYTSDSISMSMTSSPGAAARTVFAASTQVAITVAMAYSLVQGSVQADGATDTCGDLAEVSLEGSNLTVCGFCSYQMLANINVVTDGNRRSHLPDQSSHLAFVARLKYLRD